MLQGLMPDEACDHLGAGQRSRRLIRLFARQHAIGQPGGEGVDRRSMLCLGPQGCRWSEYREQRVN